MILRGCVSMQVYAGVRACVTLGTLVRCLSVVVVLAACLCWPNTKSMPVLN